MCRTSEGSETVLPPYGTNSHSQCNNSLHLLLKKLVGLRWFKQRKIQIIQTIEYCEQHERLRRSLVVALRLTMAPSSHPLMNCRLRGQKANWILEKVICLCKTRSSSQEVKAAETWSRYCFYPPSVCGHFFGVLVLKCVSSAPGLTLTWVPSPPLWAWFAVKSPLGWAGLRPSSQTYSKQL